MGLMRRGEEVGGEGRRGHGKDVPGCWMRFLRRRRYQAARAISAMPMSTAAIAIPAIAPLLSPHPEDARMAGEDVAEG